MTSVIKMNSCEYKHLDEMQALLKWLKEITSIEEVIHVSGGSSKTRVECSRDNTHFSH